MNRKWALAGAGIALAVITAACTAGAPAAYDARYFDLNEVDKINCTTVDKTKLENTLHYVQDASGGKLRDILKKSPEGTTHEALQQALSGKNELCKKQNPEGSVRTVAENGADWQLPVIPDNVDIVVGDSTKDPDTPPVLNTSVLPEKCRGAINWAQVRDCVNGEQWYIDGINRMKPFSGFNWDDVLTWADAKRPDGNPVGDARLIQVYNLTEAQKPKDVAKSDVRGLVGDDKALEKMQIAPYKGNFVNTRGLEHERVSPFVDPSRQVRVSLAPLVMKDGKAVGLNPNGGIFVDCWNIWGMAYAIAPAPDKPALCPPGSGRPNMPIPPEGPHGCNPPGTSTTVSTTTSTSTCVGCTTTTTTPPVEIKDRRQGSNYQGNVTEGGQKAQPGPGTLDPPPIVVTTTRVNPPPPPPAPPANTTQPVKPTSTGAPPPTNPGAGTSNSGTVPPPP